MFCGEIQALSFLLFKAGERSWTLEVLVSLQNAYIRSLEDEKSATAQALAKALGAAESLRVKTSVVGASLARAEREASEAAEGRAVERRSAAAEKEVLEKQLTDSRLENTNHGEKLTAAVLETKQLGAELVRQRSVASAAEAALAPLKERVADLERENASVVSEAGRLLEGRTAAEGRVSDLRTELQGVRNAATAAQGSIRALEGRVAVLVGEKSALEATLASARRELATLREDVERLGQSFRARDVAEAAAAEARSARQAAAEVAKRESGERLEALQKQLADLLSERVDAAAEARRLRSVETELRSSLRETAGKLAAVEASLRTVSAAAGTARTDSAYLLAETEKSLEAAAAENERLGKELEALRGSAKFDMDAAAGAAHSAQVAAVDDAVAPLRADIKMKEEAEGRLKLEYHQQVLRLEEEVKGLKAELLKLRRQSLDGDCGDSQV